MDSAQLRRRLGSAPVVATTCLGTKHPLFSQRRFDYCIVDEASQAIIIITRTSHYESFTMSGTGYNAVVRLRYVLWAELAERAEAGSQKAPGWCPCRTPSA